MQIELFICIGILKPQYFYKLYYEKIILFHLLKSLLIYIFYHIFFGT